MDPGSGSESLAKAERGRGPRGGAAIGSVEPKISAFVPRRDHSPRELKSWAKRTGFVSTFSGETAASGSERNDSAGFGLGRGVDRRRGGGSSPKIEIDPVLGRTKPSKGVEIEPDAGAGHGGVRSEGDEAVRAEGKRRIGNVPVLGASDGGNANRNGDGNGGGNGSGNVHGVTAVASAVEPKIIDGRDERDVEMNLYADGEEPLDGGWQRPSSMKLGLRENPGIVPLLYYGLQHYLSLAGSLIFIPLIMVPAMGGTDKFRHIMRELQGAVIVGSIFQSLLGFSGLMSFLLRLINPIVVAPTVAAVGLAFFSYGFPQAGSCVEISVPLILLVLTFTLYLRGVSIFGNRFFQIYAVPLSVMIIWTYAFFLTAGGAYDYKGCSADVPSSNILIDACRKHAYTMRHCRTDVSNALRTAAWVRIPYPLQWGIPIFHFRTSIILIFVSLVASVDSVGTYHTTSVRINLKPPTPGIVSRGIALEGFCSILAGVWGSGTGSTTLTENMHTVDITKVASRRAVELGAVLLIFFSFIGKVGAILASIPLSLAASVLCFTWALVVALGLSTLQYSRAASFRNIMIVGVSLFLGFSIPAYFQQYQPETSLILPSYFVPYAAASNGPVHTNIKQLDFAMNGLMSLNMVVTFLVAFVLENTVPGSRQERGVYLWSRPEDISTDPSSLEDYSLPRKLPDIFARRNV
ncbi:nucleobase-ascorbate transporter 11 isoform X2 [Malus sylvestris]|uniref:nucleobase-ascorbate transporter 11 isoform X2 n=1 Tax=Malus sylvestris TaxID=3752 RepID=UPI0021ABBE4D|nr:nucleobase-ascorbate transporter 11 isoform X2 [Malus sylvestris]